MNKKARATDLASPLPTQQLRGFLLFFHAAILFLIAMTLYAHWQRVKVPAVQDWVLTFLVALHVLLYIAFFALPSVSTRVTAGRWEWPAFVLGVLLVLAETVIDRAFSWALIPYVGQISVLPLRISVPTAIGMVSALVLSANWGRASFMQLLSSLLGYGTWSVLAFFLGRLIVTSMERGELILQLEKAKAELEAARQRDAELAAFRERERLARDLHDNLGHSLVTLTVQLEAAQRLQQADPPRAAALLQEMQKITRSSMEDLRRSLSNLRAPGLGERPLVEALQTLCTETASRSGIRVNCDFPPQADALPPNLAETLWRVVQESLTNVEKHAGAHQVDVHLAMPPREVLLRVRDDGIGLAPGAEEKQGHFGLRGLRERVEGLGGTLAIDSNGAGTLLETRLPLLA